MSEHNSITWHQNLDGDEIYDEFHDFSQVIMFVNHIKKRAEIETEFTTDTQTMKLVGQEGEHEVTSLIFGLGFWANGAARNKKRSTINYVEGESDRFSINLSEPDLQEVFNIKCKNNDPNGLTTFIKECFEKNRYEAI